MASTLLSRQDEFAEHTRSPGTYRDDVVKGIFCRPCSQIRNELRFVHERLNKQQLELGLIQPSVPLGATYQSMHTMPVAVPI